MMIQQQTHVKWIAQELCEPRDVLLTLSTTEGLRTMYRHHVPFPQHELRPGAGRARGGVAAQRAPTLQRKPPLLRHLRGSWGFYSTTGYRTPID